MKSAGLEEDQRRTMRCAQNRRSLLALASVAWHIQCIGVYVAVEKIGKLKRAPISPGHSVEHEIVVNG